jgi:uncharacterized protein YqgQ
MVLFALKSFRWIKILGRCQEDLEFFGDEIKDFYQD